MRRAAFLDRDGVINVDHAYVSRFEDFDFIDGVLDAARRLVDAGFVLVIVTNQSGIGRGYYTEADFHKLDQAVRAVFAEHGADLRDLLLPAPSDEGSAAVEVRVQLPQARARHDPSGRQGPRH